MAGKSKAVQSEDVLVDVMAAGIEEIRRAGIVIRVGNTMMNGGALVVAIPAWRYCTSCGGVVTVPEYDQDAGMCRPCASTGTPPQASVVPETTL